MGFLPGAVTDAFMRKEDVCRLRREKDGTDRSEIFRNKRNGLEPGECRCFKERQTGKDCRRMFSVRDILLSAGIRESVPKL